MGFSFPAMIHNFTELLMRFKLFFNNLFPRIENFHKGEKKTPRIDALEESQESLDVDVVEC